ncbi:PspC domain-containing protein [Rosettibacter firmus]|uniref:PspC domain-containing protein n=1 Tax=Rosettibacter firmus TaxID=3111522 RepID=UPI00336BC66E
MPKKLYRSRKFRVLGGVAGGLAEYFGLDPILMRVIFVLITLINGIGILLYIILWIIIPEEPLELAYNINQEEKKDNQEPQQSQTIFESRKNGKGRTVIGIILIIIGLLFLAERFIPSFCFEDIIPITLIIIGVLLIWNSVSK